MVTRFIDSHVHFFEPRMFQYSWMPDAALGASAHLPSHLFTGAHGHSPAAVVVVQGDAAPIQTEQEVSWISTLAEHVPEIAGMVAYASMEPSTMDKEVATLSKYRLVRGVRRNLEDSHREFATSWIEALRAIQEIEWTVDLCVRPDQLGQVVRLASEVPDVTFILDHLGGVDSRRGWDPEWAAVMRELSTQANIYCKISGLTDNVAEEGASAIANIIRFVVEEFGESRLLFASNWPVSVDQESYLPWVNRVAGYLGPGAEMLDAVFFSNASRVYRL